jgi:hypothetical protein
MGFDLDLFVDCVDEELICSICTDVLKHAIQLIPCQHLYCSSCLNRWFQMAPKMTCPVDGTEVNKTNITAIPRSIQNMLSKLNIKCEDCNEVMTLCKYEKHNCFQEILSQMGDYINEIDKVLMCLELNEHQMN